MELKRPQVDVGLFTNNIDAMKAFYGDNLGLEFESIMPVGGGFKQHRYIANGSIIKLMESRDPLPRRHPGGYETLMIATNRVTQPEAINDPDGNTIELVPPGRDEVTQLAVRLGVSDVELFGEFYTKAAGAVAIGHNRYKIGETIFGCFRHPLARRQKPAPLGGLAEVVKAMAALGIRYVTLQVNNCDAAFKEMTAGGAAVCAEPATFNNVVKVAFVRDPDGNFIELAQRPPT
ncbi:MAG TPA: VOC family protein [Candidatus Binataceae bacterium]|nr:VOC family protein [Candidatus Binataceae bacterium]